MLHLFSIEWLKVKQYKAFWIFLGLYAISLFSINYIVYQFQLDLSKTTPFELFPYAYPKVYQTIAWVSGWLLYFPGMLMILIVSNEFAFKTHRQNIIDGLSRRAFIISKIIMGLMLCIITTALIIINAWSFGWASTGKISFDGASNIAYSFLHAMTYVFFAMILAVLLRKSGLAITIFLMYGFIFEQLIGGIFDKFIFKAHYFFYYMPLQVTDMLVPIPFGKELLYKDAPTQSVLVMVSILYVSLFSFLAIKKFDKEDL